MEGLQPLTGSGTYADVLRMAYDKVIEQYVASYSGASRQDMENMYGVILYSILGKLSADIISPDLLEVLNLSGPIDRFIKSLAGKRIYDQFATIQRQASGNHKKFVRSYLNMIRHPNQPISAFEEPAKKLSREGDLTDVIFKVLRLAGFKLVVILVDELETIHSFNESPRRQILVDIRDFRDSLANIGAQRYPSVAFVCASTREFYENGLIRDAPALYSRWEGNETYLKRLSSSDIDNLIFKLRELFYLAGYNLRPIQEPSSGDEHEVIQLRNQVLADLTSSANPFTTRKLVRTLLRKIRRTWVRT